MTGNVCVAVIVSNGMLIVLLFFVLKENEPLCLEGNSTTCSRNRNLCHEPDMSNSCNIPPACGHVNNIVDLSDHIGNLSIDDSCCPSEDVPVRIMLDASLSLPTDVSYEMEGIDAILVSEDLSDPGQETHSSLIRYIEEASDHASTSESLSRRLFFSDYIPPPRRVIIQDSKNTVRYFSRSKEEKEFFRMKRRSRDKRKIRETPAYSTPIDDPPWIPIPKPNDEGYLSATMAETMTEAGTKFFDTVNQLQKWAVERETAKKSEESPAKPFKFGINLVGSWEETSTKISGGACSISETMRCIGVDGLCLSQLDDSSRDSKEENVEVPISKETPSTVMPLALASSQTSSHLSRILPRNSFQSDFSIASLSSVATPENMLASEEKRSDDIHTKTSKPVGRARKLDVVNGARRWNLAQRSPKSTPPECSNFLEVGQLSECGLEQPCLADSSRLFSPFDKGPSKKVRKKRSFEEEITSPVSTIEF